MTVAELGERMSSLEFTYWQAFFRLENKELKADASNGSKPAGGAED
jgi:hypothetical protein